MKLHKRHYKILFIMLILSLLVACENKEAKEAASAMKSVQSFGNQLNQLYPGEFFIKNKNEIYVAGSNVGGYNSIVKLYGDNFSETETIFEQKTGLASQLTVFDEWIYFIMEENDKGTRLYRIKENGSELTELAKEVGTYTLTNKKIYFDTDVAGGTGQIYAINLDGTQKEKILDRNHRILAIDEDWLYYYKNNDEEDHLYRIKTSGGDIKNLYHELDVDCIDGDFLMEKNHAFFISYNDIEDINYLVEKTINGKKEILASGSVLSCLNKSGQWLYFSDENKVYKMDLTRKHETQCIYNFNKNNDLDSPVYISSILVNNNDVLITSENCDSVYIRSDGTVVELGQVIKLKDN